MKPAKWQYLPSTFLETLVKEVELDYDPYESSWDEAVASILNGQWSDENCRRMDQYWASVSEEAFQRSAKWHLLWLSDQMGMMIKLVP